MISKLSEGFSYKFNNLEDALDSLEAINVECNIHFAINLI